MQKSGTFYPMQTRRLPLTLPHISVCLTLISRTNAHNIVTISAVFQPKRLLPDGSYGFPSLLPLQTNFFNNHWKLLELDITYTPHTTHDTNTNHSFKKRKGEELCRQIFPRTTIGKRVEDSSFSKLTITSASNTFKSKVNRSPARPRLGEIGSGGTASRESEGSRPESCRGLSTSYVRSYVRMLCTFEIVARI